MRNQASIMTISKRFNHWTVDNLTKYKACKNNSMKNKRLIRYIELCNDVTEMADVRMCKCSNAGYRLYAISLIPKPWWINGTLELLPPYRYTICIYLYFFRSCESISNRYDQNNFQRQTGVARRRPRCSWPLSRGSRASPRHRSTSRTTDLR